MVELEQQRLAERQRLEERVKDMEALRITLARVTGPLVDVGTANTTNIERGIDQLVRDRDAVLAKLAQAEQSYHELLFAVGMKHAGETRHQTALRYIREREWPSQRAGGRT